MKVEPVALSLSKIHEVLTSSNLTDAQKINFIKNNSSEISSIVKTHISSSEFNIIMQNRPLIKYRPIRNSFTKRGDKIILAKSLNIPTSEVDNYIKQITLQVESADEINSISKEQTDKIQTYVFRHGTKEQVVTFLDYQLRNARDILTILYTTLKYSTGGVADYFVRPIHRMDNRTLISIYKTVDKNLKTANKNGQISNIQADETAQWALARIYEIQNNQKLRNAVKAYKNLT